MKQVTKAPIRTRRITPATAPAPPPLARIVNWFASRGWKPFDFQLETWRAYQAGSSGLVHAPTGMGKSLAVWLGPVMEYLSEERPEATLACTRGSSEPLRVLWITPMRALATDTVRSLAAPIADLGLNWSIEKRTGDTSASIKLRQRDRLPSALITTPESLSLLLSYPNAREAFATLRCIVVDEWHELLSTKRGTQTELCLARLRHWTPHVRTWGLSATLGNLDEALNVLVGDSLPQRHRDTEQCDGIVRPLTSITSSTNDPPPATPIPSLCPCASVVFRCLIRGDEPKRIDVRTILPESIERFPWAGHLGLRLLDKVLDEINTARTSLLFTNTRSQAELWFRAIIEAKPDWMGRIAIHHGSLDRDVRAEVEELLRKGELLCVVCTSSLDLGVDFSPVEQVIQVGSPKGVARLLQRAGRSGHQPGAVSAVVCVPTNALELVEFAAARDAMTTLSIEPRAPLDKPLDVLVQHLVTAALGGGFEAEAMYDEVRSAWAYRHLSREEWGWCMDFVTRGGPSLGAYPRFARVIRTPTNPRAVSEPPPPLPAGEVRACPPWRESSRAEGASAAARFNHNDARDLNGIRITPDGSRMIGASSIVERTHRLNIGTISSDTSIRVKYVGGATIGTIEESFIARLSPGDRFVLGGKPLELVRVREMTAQVKRAKSLRGAVPRWEGGRSPLSTQLAHAVRAKLTEYSSQSTALPFPKPGGLKGSSRGWSESSSGTPGKLPQSLLHPEGVLVSNNNHSPEMRAIAPLLDLQSHWSRLPGADELLIESLESRDGFHVFIYPFEGRLVHEGLGALAAHRLTRQKPRSITVSGNDYGIELLSAEPLPIDEASWRRVLSPDDLLEDLLACLNSTELPRRQFRDIARVAGLIVPGFPGAGKSTRQVQASSELFFDVFTEFDPGNRLLEQARREVLQQQLEIGRTRDSLDRLSKQRVVMVTLDQLSPLSFPLWAEGLRTQHVTSESWTDRVRKMAVALESKAGLNTEENRGKQRKRETDVNDAV